MTRQHRFILLALFLLFTLCPRLSAEGVIMRVKPVAPAIIEGAPIYLWLTFENTTTTPVPISLGGANYDQVELRIADEAGMEKEYPYRFNEGAQRIPDSEFTVADFTTYSMCLNEFVHLTTPGTYQIHLALRKHPSLKASCQIIIIADGKFEIAELARQAFTTRSLKAHDFALQLSYNSRPEAVPYLIELAKKFHNRDTGTFYNALASIMRSNDPSGITWLWEQAAQGKIEEFSKQVPYIKQLVLDDVAKNPTAIKSAIVKPLATVNP
jgi:hypothetical protein